MGSNRAGALAISFTVPRELSTGEAPIERRCGVAGDDTPGLGMTRDVNDC